MLLCFSSLPVSLLIPALPGLSQKAQCGTSLYGLASFFILQIGSQMSDTKLRTRVLGAATATATANRKSAQRRKFRSSWERYEFESLVLV